MTRNSSRRGLTVVEVVLAMVIVGLVAVAVTAVTAEGVRHTASAGDRTQAAQVLDFLGRSITGGDAGVLAEENDPLEFDYGELGDNFAELADGEGVADPNRFRASIENGGQVTIATAVTFQYDLSVCYRSKSGEACVRGTTFGPEPAPGGSVPPLPGIN